jgi:REP element-mobilizing transposase RayT
MARALRIESEGFFYHVTVRGNEREKIFFSKSDYDRFKEHLRQTQDKYRFLLHCYMLMTNHFHLLVQKTYALFPMTRLTEISR